jgi:hypothetical protein
MGLRDALAQFGRLGRTGSQAAKEGSGIKRCARAHDA